MSDLVAVAYPDESAVERARENLRKAVNEGAARADDVVVIVRSEDGSFDVRQASTGVGKASAGGALLGGAIGFLFFAPLLGMAIGARPAGPLGKACSGTPGSRRSSSTTCRST